MIATRQTFILWFVVWLLSSSSVSSTPQSARTSADPASNVIHTFRCSVLKNDESNSDSSVSQGQLQQPQALCSFVVEPEASSSSSTTATTTTSMEYCLEDHYCVQVTAQVVAQPRRTESTVAASSLSPSPLNDPEGDDLTHPPVVIRISQDGAVVIVGDDVTYQEPFSQYDGDVLIEQALYALVELVQSSSSSSSMEEEEEIKILQEQAVLLVELGLGHRIFVATPSATATSTTTSTTSVDDAVINPHLEKALNALHQSQRLYEWILAKQQQKQKQSSQLPLKKARQAHSNFHTTTTALQEIQVAVANIHFHLGETYILHPKLDQRALIYYRQAERQFRELLVQPTASDGSDNTIHQGTSGSSLLFYDVTELEYSWAEACLQLGSFLLNLWNPNNHDGDSQTNLDTNDGGTSGKNIASSTMAGATTTRSATTTSSGTTPRKRQRGPSTKRNLGGGGGAAGGGRGGGSGGLLAHQHSQQQLELLQWNEMIQNAKEAHVVLENATDVYRSQLKQLRATTARRKKQRSQQTTVASQLEYDDDDENDEHLQPDDETIFAYKMKLATALQQSANALTFIASSSSSTTTTQAAAASSSLLRQALERHEEALRLLRQVLSHLQLRKSKTPTYVHGKFANDGMDDPFSTKDDDLVISDLIVAIANLYYSLSDLHLQLGQYDPAQRYYEETMDWYNEHDDQLSPVGGASSDNNNIHGMVDDTDDGTLEAYEQALEQYHDRVNAAKAARRYDDDPRSRRKSNNNNNNDPSNRRAGASSYGEYGEYDDEGMDTTVGDAEHILTSTDGDDLYEGDLHATLGTLRLSRGDYALAMGHYDQAIRLYRSSPFVSGDEEERSVADVQFNWAMALFRAGDFHQSAKVHGQALEGYRTSVGEGKNPLLHDNVVALEDDEEEHENDEDGSSTTTSSSRSASRVLKDGTTEETTTIASSAGDKQPPPTQTIPLIDLNLYQNSLINVTTGDEL